MGCDAAGFEAPFKTVNCLKPDSASFGLVLWPLARSQRAWAELGDGVYLAGSRGGQVSPGEGIFQFNAKRGYIVEKGEMTKLLRDVSLSGKILETLLHVKAVGSDLKFNSGRCGKAGQLVPVSDGSPHILVAEAMVGGAG